MSTELTPEQETQVEERVVEGIHTWMAWFLGIMKEHFGEETYRVFTKADNERVRQQWSKIAEECEDNSIENFIKIQWNTGINDLGHKVEVTESGFQVTCTKCKANDLPKRHGITEEMFYITCASDSSAAEEFNPNIGFKRTKTLMQGDDCCDHFYYYKKQ